MKHSRKAVPSRSLRERPDHRRGATIVLVAIMMVVFLASVVFSVDIAYMQLTRAQLRAATDAAARAAGEALSRAQDTGIARQAAKNIAASNLVGGAPLLLEDSDVVFGKATLQYSGSWSFEPCASPINAVRVCGRRTRDSRSGSVPTFFGAILDVCDFEPTQDATVVRLDRDICLVVDRSSSMKLYLDDMAQTMSTSDPRFSQPPDMLQSRWGALAVAVQGFIDALAATQQTEHVALVSYASNGTWCGVDNNACNIDQGLDADQTLVMSAMSTISSRVFNGATNIAAGIEGGIGVLTNATLARPYAAKTMVLMTDGHHTEGNSPHIAAQAALPHEIIIHTVTFGGGADGIEMKAVADATGGNYYHAPDAAALRSIFEEIALTLPVILTD